MNRLKMMYSAFISAFTSSAGLPVAFGMLQRKVCVIDYEVDLRD